MKKQENFFDMILIGAGIMSGTLGAFIKELAPDWKISVIEKLSSPGEESSNEWNNAGTGHAALCELNYTNEERDGKINLQKAALIHEEFLLSQQFWSYFVRKKYFSSPEMFIHNIPHMSFVQGKENVSFLQNRFKAMRSHPYFSDLEFSDDPKVLKNWIPLMMESRNTDIPVAATKSMQGTDVNFGALTRLFFSHLSKQGTSLFYQHEVLKMSHSSDEKLWILKVCDQNTKMIKEFSSPFVFIGAGGGALHLLQKSKIFAGKQIGGFPVSGLFLSCNNSEVINSHHAKVYGKAKIGAPPMSVPHLDSRFINGQKSLLFGPFAGFSPKFLKNGSYFDLLSSITANNFKTMTKAGMKNFSLTKYLLKELMLTKEQRLSELQTFIPTAQSKDWDLSIAGQRVQIIQPDGSLQFGTEVVHSDDRTVAALLGASPGASTAVFVMLEVLKTCFPDLFPIWIEKIKEMIPSYDRSLIDNPSLLEDVRSSISHTLHLTT